MTRLAAQTHARSRVTVSTTGTRYDTGDAVATPDGRGVVAAVLTEDFGLPQRDEEVTVDDLTDEFDEDHAKQLANATKDELLRTERWRSRF